VAADNLRSYVRDSDPSNIGRLSSSEQYTMAAIIAED
jgi:hypothetical protein